MAGGENESKFRQNSIYCPFHCQHDLIYRRRPDGGKMNILKIRQLIMGVEDSLADLRTAIEDIYSEPAIRAKVEEGLKKGKSIRSLARDCGVPRETLRRLVNDFPENENTSQ